MVVYAQELNRRSLQPGDEHPITCGTYEGKTDARIEAEHCSWRSGREFTARFRSNPLERRTPLKVTDCFVPDGFHRSWYHFRGLRRNALRPVNLSLQRSAYKIT